MNSIKTPESGFTLTELMIAMLISLVIAAGAIQLFQHSLSAVNKANEIQRNQQTLLATIEHLLPRVRQASSVTEHSDSGKTGVLVTRIAGDISPGYDCTGAPVNAEDEVKEWYYSDGEDLWCENIAITPGPRKSEVAFGITDISLKHSYEDDNGDGHFVDGDDTLHDSAFPTTGDFLGVELEIVQPMPDGGARTIPIHVALRNNTLSGRSQNGDFDDASGS